MMRRKQLVATPPIAKARDLLTIIGRREIVHLLPRM
jgi:hypothetical protein